MNSAPLFPKSWNVWAIALSGEPQEIGRQHSEVSTLNRIKSWLNDAPSDVAEVQLLEPITARKVLRRREQMSRIPMLDAGPVFEETIAFWYDGTQNSMPWPASSDVMALKIYAPDRQTKPPETWSDKAAAIVRPPVEGVKSLVLTLAFAAVLIAGAIWVSKRSMRDTEPEGDQA